MKKRSVKVGVIAQGILTVVAAAGVVSIIAVFPGVTMALAPFFKKKKYSPKQVIERNIDSLVKNGLLQRVNQNGVPSLRLTKLGKWETGIRRIDRSSTKKERWDGLWRVIVFDVPEDKNKARQELRRAVKLYGFHRLQKSVWVYPYPCEDFVVLVKNTLGVNRDVLYMIVNYIENDKELKRHFKVHA